MSRLFSILLSPFRALARPFRRKRAEQNPNIYPLF